MTGWLALRGVKCRGHHTKRIEAAVTARQRQTGRENAIVTSAVLPRPLYRHATRYSPDVCGVMVVFV
jgi:hypothetical protein